MSQDQQIVVPPIQTMDQFRERIKEWVQLDNQINKYNKKLRELRTNRSLLSKRAATYMETNNQEGLVINIADGKLKFFETRTKGVPSMAFLRTCFLEFFNSDEERVKELLSFIQQKLPVKEDKGLKRYFVNSGGGGDGNE
tara:strand:- start:36 stop:455 length:420 start_codon:yes stop_codon:yes gene_type:complete